MTDMHDTADLVSKALRRAWQLGQTYWQQADSEYQSHWKKADATQATFDQLVEDTRAAILTSNSGAQPAPSGEDDAVRKSWARFSNELHRSPDAPYPGMSEAFERHFSQSFTAREWRAESGVWAAAWKAAKNHGAQPAPSVPTTLLVAVADLVAQMEIVSRVGFVDTPNDKDSCAAFCVAEGTWLELMRAVESLASALAAAPEAKP